MSKKDKVIHSKYFYGQEIPEKDLQDKRLSYRTLANAFDCVLNNNIIKATSNIGYWDIVNGSLVSYIHNDDYTEITEEEYEELSYEAQQKYYKQADEVFQFFIISDCGYNLLSYYTDELVFYNEELNMYVWGIKFYGTSWDYVSTEIKIDVDD